MNEESEGYRQTRIEAFMFLRYINVVGSDITSTIRLFADDSLLYQEVKSELDCFRIPLCNKSQRRRSVVVISDVEGVLKAFGALTS